MRTAMAYIANQVRRADYEGGVGIGKFRELDALMLTEEIGETTYITFIYCYEGHLYELFVEKGFEGEPEGGTILLPVNSFVAHVTDEGLLSLSIEDLSGGQGNTLLLPRSGVKEGLKA